MSVDAFLRTIANECYVRDTERERIDRSIAAISARLGTYFALSVESTFVFGSYARGTILPRLADPRSDIDLMVIFADGDRRPQTYLNRLGNFVRDRYSRSEVRQANPTIQLEMNHIRVELVPGVRSYFGDLQIPAKARDYQDWIATNPTEFNHQLTQVNSQNNNHIKRLIRVLKRWNAANNYVFDSYGLEQQVVRSATVWLGGYQSLQSAFFQTVPELGLPLFTAEWRVNALRRLRETTREAQEWSRRGYPETARQSLVRIIPRLQTA